MDEALASVGRRKKGRPLRDSWRSYCQDAVWHPAASGGTTPFPIRLPLPQVPICLLRFGAGLQMGKIIRGTRMKLWTT